jgi:hypothetical protein
MKQDVYGGATMKEPRFKRGSNVFLKAKVRMIVEN